MQHLSSLKLYRHTGLMIALACVVATTISLSCGSEENPKAPEEDTTIPATRRLVTDEQIAQAPKDSPQRALLSFFQAIQFKDVPVVRDLITRRAMRKITYERLRGTVDIVGGALGKPNIRSVRRRENTAAARLLILGFEPGKPDATAASPATFALRRENGSWRIDNLDYVFATANELAEASKRSP